MKQTTLKSNRVNVPMILCIAFSIMVALGACKKDPDDPLKYYEVGIRNLPADWRDSSFVVATSNQALISQLDEQLALPVSERKIVNGALAKGSGGYNKNGSFTFNWHFNETDWQLTENSIEIYDGRAYSDVHLFPAYWQDTIKRFSPWNSYIKKALNPYK